jgi:hypothetical protein
VPGRAQLILDALEDASCAWSVGTFGAIGEFERDADEDCSFRRGSSDVEIVTRRGGIRVTPREEVSVIAYQTFVGDGETWGNAVAFCLPREGGCDSPRVIRDLGPDRQALRPEERAANLFDLGVGLGHVSMCARTVDPELATALNNAIGHPLLSPGAAACAELMRRTSPTRVLVSPIARIEVYSAIPAAGGKSPTGPHTHLLPKLLASGRTHSANAPIPDGFQPVLGMHPRSPWRDSGGRRSSYDAARARAFDVTLSRFGLPCDQLLRAQVETAIRAGVSPCDLPAPLTRHGRIQLRIVLRRLAQEIGLDATRPWREAHDTLRSVDEGDAGPN